MKKILIKSVYANQIRKLTFFQHRITVHAVCASHFKPVINRNSFGDDLISKFESNCMKQKNKYVDKSIKMNFMRLEHVALRFNCQTLYPMHEMTIMDDDNKH